MALRMLKAIAVVAAIIVAVVIIQAMLVVAFYHSVAHGSDEIETGTGWCMLFTCERMSYVSEANVTEPSLEVGFGPGPNDLKFGLIPKGTNGKRFLNIENDDSTQAKVRLVAFGNISSYIHFSSNDLIIESGGNRDITVDFRTVREMDTGHYTGGIAILRLSPKHELFNFLMELV